MHNNYKNSKNLASALGSHNKQASEGCFCPRVYILHSETETHLNAIGM